MFIKTLYHELKHYKQLMANKNGKTKNLDTIRYDIETFIMQNDYEHYDINHDRYYFEMEAELYALNKSLKYLKGNGLLSDNLRFQYEKERELILFRMYNFHMYPFLKKVHEIMQMEFIEAPSWLNVFYNEDGTFKTVGEILNSYHIEEDVLNMFFSSEDFLNNIDFSSLTIEQQNIIVNALQTSYNLDIERYKNNFKFLKGGIVTQKMVLKANREITKRLVYYSKKLEELKKINYKEKGRCKWN